MMKIFAYLIIAIIVGTAVCDDRDVQNPLISEINEKILSMNRLTAKLEWESATKPSRDIFSLKQQFSLIRNNWRNKFCSRLDYISDDKSSDMGTIYLLCRGPAYSSDQARILTIISDELLMNYATRKVCRMEMEKRKCYHGEPDLGALMSTSR